MNDAARQTGLFASVRRLLATALELAQVRLALLGTEVELQTQRLFGALLWGAVGLLALGLGLVLLCGFVILLFWEGYRLAAVGVLTLLFLGAATLLLRESRQRLRRVSGMFAASLTELDRDRARLQASGQDESK